MLLSTKLYGVTYWKIVLFLVLTSAEQNAIVRTLYFQLTEMLNAAMIQCF
jgi:hypothetical protein